MQDVDNLGRFHSQGYTVGGCAKLLGRLRKEAQDKLVEIGLLPEKDKKTGKERGLSSAVQSGQSSPVLPERVSALKREHYENTKVSIECL